MDIFDRYAPFVQDFIYRNNWESLRAIQAAAGDAIFNTDENVLLSASTASGKTEVYFHLINEVLKKACREPYYEGIIGVTDEELVSSDFIGDPHSCIVDLPLTDVVGGNMIKVVAWYDNEWGYSNRLVELAIDFGKGV